ncbi:COR domain-containing protein [Streptomyces sp. NPDC059989]|uniref:COR domain-containing protein n=1 Tax=Streptomyces sp. NPDC059989 TaxID=3347026 RepID=UPI0036ADF45D
MDDLSQRIEEARLTGDLDLSRIGLDGIRDALRRLNFGASVRRVDLSNNSLSSEIPEEISRILPSLEHVDLSGNALSSFPKWVAELPRLKSLILDRNGIRRLQVDQPEKLKGLAGLSVSRNGVEVIDSSACRLEGLAILDLSGNIIGSLPMEFAQLRRLKDLDLGDNPGLELGEEIADLKLLRRLSLRRNGLTKLSYHLGYLSPDIQLDLDENFLDENVSKLVERGAPYLLPYLRTLDAEPHYEAKLILVGEGRVGKTSLVEALRGNPFDADRDSTHGIEIKTFSVDFPLGLVTEMSCDEAGEEITVRSWDFGGQKIYRVTHQFFFTRQALYFVTWNPREGDQANLVEQWISRIKLRCGDSARVLVVSTHADEGRPEDIDHSELREKFGPLLVGHQRVDSKSGYGIPELTEKLAHMAAGLPRMGERISERWEAVQNDLLNRREPYVKRATFDRICDRHGVDEDEAEALAALLNDLGYIVYYPEDDDLRELIILQPEWLTLAISYVLEDEETRQNSGILEHSSLARIWGDAERGYVPEMHPYFLRLMEKFDISYRIHDETASLIAELVPYERPNIPWPDPGGSDELSMLCHFSDAPTGLIPWLTVRTRRFAGRQWNKGFYLEHPKFDARALVELISDTRLSVKVVGGSRALLFDVLRDTIDQLVKLRWPGVSHQIRIPCPGDGPGGVVCPNSFPVEGLEKLRSRKKSSFLCVECSEEQDVDQILSGISTGISLRRELVSASEIESVQAKITAAHQDIVQLSSDARQFQEKAGAYLHLLMILAKAGSAEIADCPKLFSMQLAPEQRWDPRAIWSKKFILHLWCEETGSQHPVSPPYEFRSSKEWVVSVAPYLRIAASAVSLLAPIVGGVAGAVDVAAIKDSADLMKSLADSVHLDEGATSKGQEVIGLSASEGAALRAFREFLFELDETRKFRDLQRVLTPTGDWQWLCAHHYAQYEPSVLRIYPGVSRGESNIPDSN